jgi:23S rRNA pseudouridine2457 synthase
VLVAFHKPWGVLSRFTSDGSPHRTLADFGLPPRVYPIGRLDADSEGLLLLSDEPRWNALLLEPRRAHPRRYWVQVEGIPEPETLTRLARGITVQSRTTLPRLALQIPPPAAQSPVRYRKTVPDRWIASNLSRAETARSDG